MKILMILSFISSSHAIAALNIKPGLWSISTKMKGADGKEHDPMAQMKAAMAKMTPEQKKQMEAMTAKMMKQTGQDPAKKTMFNMDSGGMQMCYTAEMLKDESIFARQKEHECDVTIPVKTSNRVVTEFKCKNGSQGTAEWNIKDPTHYSGLMKMTSKNGKKTEINHEGTFVSPDCGKVAPITDLLKKQPVKR